MRAKRIGTERDDEFRERFADGALATDVAQAMHITRSQASHARQRLGIPTRGVAGKRGGARGRAQIKRERP